MDFKISQHLVKLRAQCVWALSCWTRQISWVWQETSVVNCCYIDFNL